MRRLLLLALACLPGLAWADSYAEEDMRAIYLYNFANYTDWPESPRDTFNLCVLNDASLGRALKNLEGKSIGKKPLVTAHLTSLASVRQCQLLYVGAADTYRLDKIAAALGNEPALTVSNAPVLETVAIVMTLEDARLVFDINLEAYRRVGLKPSSTLLRLARHIKKTP